MQKLISEKFLQITVAFYELAQLMQKDFVRVRSSHAEEVAAPPMHPNPQHQKENRHRWIEKRPVQFAVLALVVILIGGLVEIIPTYVVKSNIPTISSVRPYQPLELQGRDIYVREGCNTCHSQMVRPFRSETERYGEYSKAGEFVYDTPRPVGIQADRSRFAPRGAEISEPLALSPYE